MHGEHVEPIAWIVDDAAQQHGSTRAESGRAEPMKHGHASQHHAAQPTLVDDSRGYGRHHACAWSRLRFASMLYNHGRTWVKPHGTASIHVSMYAAGKKYWRGCLRLRRTGSGQRDCQGPWEAWHEAHSLYRVVLGTSRVHLDADTARAAASLSAANGSFTSVSRGVQTTAQVCGGARGRVSWARRAVDGSDEAERASARHHGLIQG